MSEPSRNEDFSVEGHQGEHLPRVMIRVRGEVDLVTTPVWERRLNSAIHNGAGHVIVDMREVLFCDLSALKMLLRVQLALQSQGRRLSVRGPCSLLEVMVHALGLQEQLTISLPPHPDGDGPSGPTGT